MKLTGLRGLVVTPFVALLAACAPPPAVRVVGIETPAPAPSRIATVPAPAPRVVPAPLPAAGTDLAARIDAYIAQDRFRHAAWGIDVVDLASGDVRYSHRAQELFVPASNTKLYTAALALDTFGGDARFHTTLYTTATTRANSVLSGDLILYGGGDPSLGDGAVTPDTHDWAEHFAQVLANLGIRQVSGDIIGDDTRFHGPGYGGGWEAGDLQTWYAPPASALSNGGNTIFVEVSRQGTMCCRVAIEPDYAPVQVQNFSTSSMPGDALAVGRAPGTDVINVGGNLPPGAMRHRVPLSVPDPALLAAYALRDALSRRGIRLDGRIRAVHWPQASAVNSRARVLADIASPPLRELVRQMLKQSDNLYAQVLLLDVGVQAMNTGTCPDRSTPPSTSEQWGLCAMRRMLKRIGIGGDATFTEGSGLSRQDLVTPAATTSLLMWTRRQPFAADFLAALPVAGSDGTLRHRLQGTLADGNLKGKTGTLTHVHALSGYVDDAAGKPLAFAIYLNRYLRPRDDSGRALPPRPRDDLDAVAALIAGDGAAAAPPTQ